MSQDLLDHPMFVDEAHNLHQSTAMAAKKRVNFPDFLDTLTPNQGRNFLHSEIAYDNYLVILHFRFFRFVL